MLRKLSRCAQEVAMRRSEEAEWRAQQLSAFVVIALVLLLASVLLGLAARTA